MPEKEDNNNNKYSVDQRQVDWLVDTCKKYATDYKLTVPTSIGDVLWCLVSCVEGTDMANKDLHAFIKSIYNKDYGRRIPQAYRHPSLGIIILTGRICDAVEPPFFLECIEWSEARSMMKPIKKKTAIPISDLDKCERLSSEAELFHCYFMAYAEIDSK
jgi:hypothetical protein